MGKHRPGYQRPLAAPGPRDCRQCGARFDPIPSQLRTQFWVCAPCRRVIDRAKNQRAATRPHKASDQTRAHNRVKHALGRGLLTRQPCEACGEPRAQAHHDDYSKPLDVRWLCAQHHRAHHAAMKKAA